MNTFSKTLGALALVGATSGASAATVSFFDLTDSDPGNYDIGTTTASGNVLTLGVTNFVASAPGTVLGIPVPFANAFDTISFKIQAPVGYYITKLSYAESGTYNNDDPTFTYATGSWVVDGTSQSLGIFFQGGADGQWSLSKDRMIAGMADLISVSITNNLFAVAPTGAASIAKTAASLTVEIAPIPVPPAVWMLGSAIVGLATVGRRKSA